MRRTQLQVRHDLQSFQIKIRLVKTIEQYQTIGSCLNKAFRHVRNRGEKRTQFECQRNLYRGAHIFDQLHIGLFQFRTEEIWICWQVIDVEFQGISSSLLHTPSILHPSSRGNTVQTANHRNVYGSFDAREMLQVGIWLQVKALHVRKIAQGLGKTVGVALQVVVQFMAFMRDLLLKQGVHHDGGGTRILQSAHPV